MRVIRFNLTSDIRKLLAELATEFGLEKTLIFDLFALLRTKGNGIPSAVRIKKMAKKAAQATKAKETTLLGIMSKRAQQLKGIVAAGPFKSMCARKDSIDALRLFVTNFLMLQKKMRQAACMTCQLKKDCDFGKQYGSSVRDISKAMDPDYKQKVHEDCPSLPEIDMANQLAAACRHWSAMMKQNTQNAAMKSAAANQPGGGGGAPEEIEAATVEQEAADDDIVDEDDSDDIPELDPQLDGFIDQDSLSTGGGGSLTGSRFKAKHDGNSFINSMALIAKMSASQLAIFSLGEKFTLNLTSKKKGKYAPTPNTDKSSKPDTIKSISEIGAIDATQHALPDEVFNQKLEKKSLSKQTHLKQEFKKKMLYLMIDGSGSMQSWLGGGNFLSRGHLSSTLSLSILKRCEEDGGIAFCRFFAHGVGRLHEARTPDDFKALEFAIANFRYNQGGTDILRATRCALSDVENAKDDLASVEVLVITDCEDGFDTAALKAIVKGREFNVLDVSGGAGPLSTSALALKSCATKYFRANSTAVDVEKIIETI